MENGSRYEYTGCLGDRVLTNRRRGACSMKSPWNAAMRLYWGEYANSSPVPNGEPAAGLDEYRSRIFATASMGVLLYMSA